VHLGLTVETINDDGHQVSVTFTDGTSGQYDLVVGADGLRSRVRTMIFGDDLQPVYEGQMCWRYNLPKPADVKDIAIWLGDPKVGIVPMSPDLMYIFITDGSAGNEIPRFAEHALADEMRSRLSGYGGVIADLARQITDSSKVVVRPFETILVEGDWNKGRVVLVGDSAHAMTAHIAQGAAMAIEDAVVLSEELRKDQSLDDTLRRYNQRRYPRVSKMIDLCRQICIWEREHTPEADVMGVTVQSMKLAAQPI
jgi:2-polyprenyl-6-methoxyphenol hydroxylase-like FAD-dependent oxidoreductase